MVRVYLKSKVSQRHVPCSEFTRAPKSRESDNVLSSQGSSVADARHIECVDKIGIRETLGVSGEFREISLNHMNWR